MKRFISAALLGSVLALPSLSSAIQPETATPESKPASLQVQSRLSASSRRQGLAAHFTAEKAYFWGCTEPCSAGGEATLSLEVPKEARSERRRIEIVGTKEDPVLWVRFGSDALFYSILVMGAPTEGTNGGPLLLLKGWAGEKSEQKTSLKKDVGGGLTLELAPEASFCGRSAPSLTRVLRPEEARFVTVRAPALSAKEREAAERIAGHPWTESESILVALEARGQHSVRTPVDGDRSTVWDGAFEFTELEVPSGIDQGKWIVEFAAPLSEPTALYVVVSEKVYQAEFAPSASRRYVLDLGALAATTVGGGAADGDAPNPSCVALVQPRTPAQVTEIMGAATQAGARTTSQLVSELKSDGPPLVDALLRLRGAEAGQEIARNYGSMSSAGQSRAFAVAKRLPGHAGLPVFVRAVGAGGAEAAEAAQLLASAGREGSKALFGRLRETDVDEEQLIATLSQIDPNFAARHFPLLLGNARTERRAPLRDALNRLVKIEAPRAELSGWFSPPTKRRKLSPGAEVELLRALESELPHLPGALGALARRAESADFEQAYLLAPLVVKNYRKLEASRAILERYLAGKVAGKLDHQAKAALSVRTLEAILEHGDPELRQTLADSLSTSLESENMRVRRAGLFNLARRNGASSDDAEPILDLLSQDEWPQVRAAAALAVLPAPGKKWDERSERIVLRRLEREKNVSVRRSLVHALAAGSGEAIVGGVRRAFEKDDDYSVRAEAAVSLGKLCDRGAIDALTLRARQLGTELTDDGPIELGLSSVTALAYLSPTDINKRLAPLLSDKASRLTRSRVLSRIEAVKASPDRDLCRR